MDMGEIIGDSFKFPVSNWKRLLIFGVIIVLSQFLLEIMMGYGRTYTLVFWLVIPSLIASILMNGYQLRTIGTSIRGEDEPPVFNEWTRMLLEGLRVIVLTLLYMIIPTLVLIAGFALLIAGSSGVSIFGLLVLLLGLIMLFIVGVILVMATANLAYYEEFGAGLRFDEILERIKSIGWLNYILMLIIIGVIYFLMALGAALVSMIPFVGLFITCLIVYPYLYLFISRAVGLIFRETLDNEEFEEDLVEDETFSIGQ